MRRMAKVGRGLFEHCSAIVLETYETQVESVRKMNEKQDEKCADLRTISAIILHSPESGIVGPTETTQQATSDDQLIALWLHGRPDTTQRAYRAETIRFMGYVEKPIRSVKLIDLQVFADHLGEAGLKPPSVHRAMSAIKSLFAFGFRLGYTQFDVGRALRIPGFRNELAERILGEAEVLRIISLEPNPRNRAMLLTLYAGGFRVSEICSLKWRHLQERDSSGQITVFGKGGKTRTVLMPKSVWETLQTLQQDAPADAPVFKSRKKGHLDESQVWRIVTNKPAGASRQKKALYKVDSRSLGGGALRSLVSAATKLRTAPPPPECHHPLRFQPGTHPTAYGTPGFDADAPDCRTQNTPRAFGGTPPRSRSPSCRPPRISRFATGARHDVVERSAFTIHADPYFVLFEPGR